MIVSESRPADHTNPGAAPSAPVESCPTCGQAVRVQSSAEGTCSYVGVEAEVRHPLLIRQSLNLLTEYGELLDLLIDVVNQACRDPDGTLDPGALSAYETALEWLAQHGHARKLGGETGRTYVWVTEEKAD